MSEDSWPNIGPDELRRLWDLYAPPFIRLDDVDRELPLLKERFLGWLEASGIELSKTEDNPPPALRRVRIERVCLTQRGQTAEATVAMSFDGRRAEAKRSGAANRDEVVRLVATAAVLAVRQLAPTIKLELDKALILESNSHDRIAIVSICETWPRDAKYVGACRVEVDTPEATVKATLDAINRRLENVGDQKGDAAV